MSDQAAEFRHHQLPPRLQSEPYLQDLLQQQPSLLSPSSVGTSSVVSRHQKRHSDFTLPDLNCDVEMESVTCDRVEGHEHFGQVMADSDLPMGIDQLAACLLADGPWFRAFLRRRQTFGVEVTEFPDEGGRVHSPGSQRSVRYWLAINYTIGPKKTLVEETQTYRHCEPGRLHIVDSECHNRDIPYGTSFHTVNCMCLTSRGPGKSHLTVTSRIVFTKSVLLAKAFIESNVKQGSQAYFRLMVATLLDPDALATAVATTAASAVSASDADADADIEEADESSRAEPRARTKASTSATISSTGGLPNASGRAAKVVQSAAAGTVAPAKRPSASAAAAARNKRNQRVLLSGLLIVCLLMLGCLLSLHLRFQSLNQTLAQLTAMELEQSRHSAQTGGTSCAERRPGFTDQQLNAWRRVLDQTLASLDNLVFELRQVATAATTTTPTAGSVGPAASTCGGGGGRGNL